MSNTTYWTSEKYTQQLKDKMAALTADWFADIITEEEYYSKYGILLAALKRAVAAK